MDILKHFSSRKQTKMAYFFVVAAKGGEKFTKRPLINPQIVGKKYPPIPPLNFKILPPPDAKILTPPPDNFDFIPPLKKIRCPCVTIYDYGSVTKTFASLLMAKYFVQQKLNIWDPIDKYLPEDLGLRQSDGTPIELIHLATHTSGMPRMPDNYDSTHPAQSAAEYDREMLYDYLESYDPINVGLHFSYSNLGFGTLGDTLSIVENDGRGFKQLVEEEIIAPLGLDISYSLNGQEDEDNYAQGYE